jgi:hypothetical protein
MSINRLFLKVMPASRMFGVGADLNSGYCRNFGLHSYSDRSGYCASRREGARLALESFRLPMPLLEIWTFHHLPL